VWRQTALVLKVTIAGITEHVTVDPQELREALVRNSDEADPRPVPGMRGRELLRLKRP